MTSIGIFLGGFGLFLLGVGTVWRVSLEDKAGRFRD